MRTLLLIFTCKRPKYADTGGRGGQKTVKFCGRPLWMAPKEKIESGALFITLLTFRTSRKIYEGLKHKSNHICYIQTALSPLDTGIMFSALDTTFLDNRFLRFKNILALDNLFSLWVKYFALDNIFSCKITGISRWITCFHIGVHLFRAGKHVFTLKYTFSASENMFLRWTT